MNKHIKNITGQKFGRLIVLSYIRSNKHRSSLWECLCDCGNKKIILANSLKLGATRSCGCLNDEVRRQKHLTSEQAKINRKKSFKNWYHRNQKQQVKRAINYMNSNKEKYNANRRRRLKERMSDPLFRLAKNLRGRLNVVLKNGIKTGSAVRDLGCSVEELRRYLQTNFYSRVDGTPMSWNNYGKKGWNIDHVVPLLTLKKGKTVQELCHYTNLRPLWYEDNLKKRSLDLQALGLVA